MTVTTLGTPAADNGKVWTPKGQVTKTARLNRRGKIIVALLIVTAVASAGFWLYTYCQQFVVQTISPTELKAETLPWPDIQNLYLLIIFAAATWWVYRITCIGRVFAKADSLMLTGFTMVAFIMISGAVIGFGGTNYSANTDIVTKWAYSQLGLTQENVAPSLQGANNQVQYNAPTQITLGNGHTLTYRINKDEAGVLTVDKLSETKAEPAE